MIPPGVLSAVGLPFGELLATVPEAGSLYATYQLAARQGPARGIFSRFIGEYFDANKGATRDEAREAYYQAKAWYTLGSAYERAAPDQPIDPNLYRKVESDRRFAAEHGDYVTRIAVDVVDPNTGDTRTYGVAIRDELTWSVADLLDRARDAVAEIIAKYSDVYGDSSLDDLDVTYRITDYIQYV